MLWVIGVGADGYREHLGVWLNPTESGLGWRRVLPDAVPTHMGDLAIRRLDQPAHRAGQ